MVLLENNIKDRIKDELMIVDPIILDDDLQNFFQNEYKAQEGRDKLKTIDSTELKEKNLENLKEQVSYASYNIRIGKKIMIESNQEYELSKYHKVELKPFEVAIIQTYEIINIPLDLIGRWNIKVKQAYEGLVWVGGPQVDPGYCGYLYCPVYNMSDKKVVLEFGKDIATMDFVKTTNFNGFEGFDKTILPFEAYKNKKLKSAITTLITEKLDDVDNFKERIEDKLHKFQTTFLTVIGALFATLSILIISMKGQNEHACKYIVYLALGLSVASFINSSKDIFKYKRWAVFSIGSVFVVLAIILIIKILEFI